MKKIILLYSVFSVLNLFSQNYTSKTAGQPSGNSQEVGITTGQLSVSLTGGATYQVPIAVPPGINGVAPQIALGYNSQGGNGMAGYGWNISGVSAISRIPSTKFHDNFIDGVDFDGYDRFALDGQRLILKSGTYGGSNAVYETENYSTIKVVSYSATSTGPSYFKVFYPDGTTAFYGNTTDSKNGNIWSIKKWINPQDIRITYYYTKTDNSLYINRINYGRRATDASLNSVEFVYKTRNRAEQAYINGTSYKNTKILSEIRAKGGTSGFRNYSLEYNTTSLGYERLIKITEKSGDNSKSYNPTLFTYDNTNNNDLFNRTESSLGLTNVNALNSSYISGDFNGDAKMDMIVYPKTGIDTNKKYWLITNTNVEGGYDYPKVHNVGKFEDIFPVSWLNENSKLMTQQGWAVVKNENGTYQFKVYSNGISNSIQDQYEKVINNFPIINFGGSCIVQNRGVYSKKFLSGDFNGDGLTDVMAIDTYLGYSCTGWGGVIRTSKRAYFIDLNRNKTSDFWNYAGEINNVLPQSTNDYDIQVGDFNGDGKSDFFIIQENKMTVYSLDNNNQLIILADIVNDTDIKKDKPHLLGDYNGDGKIDILMPLAENQDNWAFYFSRGNSFKKKIGSTGFNYAPFYSGNVRIAGVFHSNVTVERYYIPNDINADGRTDIVFVGNYTYNSTGNNIVTFTNVIENMGSTPSEINFNFDLNNSTSHYQTNIKRYPLPAFLNQNNLNQNLELALLSSNKIHHFKHTKDHRQDVLLRQVTTGNGVVETINYKPLVQENNPDEIQLYRPTFNETYPNVNINKTIGIQVVSKLEKQSKDQYSKQIYSYYGAVSNVEGLGFLGFESSYRSNWYNDDYNPISNVTKHDISKRGAVYESYTSYGIQYNFQNTPSNFISKTINNYTVNLSPKNVFKLINTSSTSYNGLQNTSISSTITYDNYNNPLTSTTVSKEGGATQETTITTLTYTHNSNGGSSLSNSYYIGRVQKKNVQTSSNGDTYTSEGQFIYNNKMLLTQSKRKGHNTNFITDNYIYDVYGNITHKTIIAEGTSRINSYEYDTTGRFLIKETDVEGLQTQYYYDANGYLLKDVNPYGITKQYQYDVWGKSIKETDYLGNQTNIVYSRSGIYTQFTINAPDGSKSYKKFDDLGREIQVGSYGFSQKWDYIQTEYDIYNRRTRVSEPYNGSATQFNTSSYDVYGRLNQTVTASGKITNISYSGLTTTTTDGYRTVITVKNSLNQVMRMTDDGGTINYLYFANGNLKRSTFDGVITSMQYDGWGRKIKLTNPSAGVYQYEYNAFGEIIKEITPKGETTLVLDAIGKLTQKNVQGDYTNLQSNYIYDPTTKLLSNITSNTGATYTYLYNSYKRLYKTTESNAYAIFERTITFDGLGRTNTERYKAINLADNKTSDITTRNIYKNGALYKILNNADQSELWRMNTINQRGQITDALFGNGMHEYNSYDAYGLPTRIRSLKFVGKGDNIDLNYKFNTQRGILLNRTSNIINHTENFQYDNLNRLIQFNNASGYQEIQNYDGKGRITNNALGDFVYANSGKPYQNTSIGLSSFGEDHYSENPQQNIRYNAFKAPVSISVLNDGATSEQIDFQYNIFQQRSMMLYELNHDPPIKGQPYRQFNKAKYYSWDGAMEINRNIAANQSEFITYIGGDAYSAPIVYKSGYKTGEFLYLHRDYLGSIVAISNQKANFIEKRHFDAWGNVTKVLDQYGNTLDDLTVFDRGYTGHEHLESVGLINMNARLYDASLHRFLAPDNFVQDPFNTQNYNRYSYVVNNPLSYIDQNGEFFWFAVAIGALIGGFSQAINGGNFGDILFGTIAGGIIGGVSAGVGNLAAGGAFYGGAAINAVGFSAGFSAGAAAGAVGGFLSSAANTWYNGGSFLDGIGSGIRGAVIGGFLGGAINGISAGIRANKMGLNFWDGKSLSRRTIQFIKLSGFEPGDPIVASDKNLIKAQKAWIPDAPMENVVNFTTENVPEKLQLLMENAGAGAATPAQVKGGVYTGKSSLYVNSKLAFSSAKQLYYVLTHEFMHVSQHVLLKGVSTSINTFAFRELKELSAYSYESSLGSSNYGGFTAQDIRYLSTQFPNYYKKFQFYNFSWTKTVKFTKVDF